MFGLIRGLLDSSSLSPHGICLLWRPELLWTHVVSDGIIAAAYFSISATLAYFLTRRRDISFGPMIWAFATFILACGATHVMSIWTLWHPDYGIEATIKALTAVASIATAIALWPLLPKAIAWPSPVQLQAANAELQTRIAERDEAMAALQRETAARLEAEHKLRHAQKMEAVGQLTGGVAHDFNNLMTVVLANLERAGRQSKDEAAVAKALQNAEAGARRAAALTKQLLAFSRREPLAPTTADLNEVVSQAADLAKGLLTDQIHMRLQLEPELPPVTVDVNGAVNALFNLVTNARDAMPDGGELTLSTGVAELGAGEVSDLPAGDYVSATVSDTGVGMTPEAMEKAFEPFFTTKPLGQGTGLGLSQVYGFMRQSGGDVAIASTPGAGASVTLYLPVRQEPT